MAASLVCMVVLLVYAYPAAGEPVHDTDAVLAAKLAAGTYSPRGADTCLGCHDESEPFATAAVFETVHGHPGIDGSPFADAVSSAFPAGLQCEACHGPAGNQRAAHAARRRGAGTPSSISVRGATRRPICRITFAWRVTRTMAAPAGPAAPMSRPTSRAPTVTESTTGSTGFEPGPGRRNGVSTVTGTCGPTCSNSRPIPCANTSLPAATATTRTAGPAPAMPWCASRRRMRPV